MSRKASPKLVLAVVGFGVFIAADDLTVVATMFRPIIGDLGIVLPDGLNQMAWIVNAYLIAYVAVMPFMGRLSDVWGRRRTYIASLALFLAGSIVVPLAPNYGIFLVGRVLTAMGGGALVPIGLAIVADVFAENRRARALGALGRSTRLDGCGVRSTARCSCGSCRGAGSSTSTSPWPSWASWPPGRYSNTLASQRTARIDWVGAGTLRSPWSP